MAIRTHGSGRVFHGDDSTRTGVGLWRDGDVFIVRSTGATWVRTDGAWVQDYAASGHTHADGSLLDNGTVTGDFLRWDGDSWAVASEPISLTQLNLTPALVAALDIEGGMFYKSTDKSVYVCTNAT